MTDSSERQNWGNSGGGRAFCRSLSQTGLSYSVLREGADPGDCRSELTEKERALDTQYN